MSDVGKDQVREIPVTWKTDPGELPAVYANLVAVTVTADDVLLTFGQRTVSEKEKVGWILPVAKVAIPRSVLPSLVKIMQGSLTMAAKAEDGQDREEEK